MVILKKIFKVFVILIFVVIGIGLLLVAFVWGSMKWNRHSKEKEAIRYQKEVCDTIKTVDGKFEIKFLDFSKKELNKIHFYLQQDKLLVKDTVVKVDFKNNTYSNSVIFPFKNFNINDRIIVEIGKRYFILSGIKYKAYYNYGMFGPVGNRDCKNEGFETINGEPAGFGTLVKEFGLLNYQLPPW
ncbi:hypothetical protein EZ449_03540 [Pedobacter frigidisoli]|uniref:Uncharacterized protein n=1 Tax=Pedobacter frigidisoli TaxID=2530455 RepID=A0A4R0P5E5_9SPHI|nr:hypothetical protein [Pedobacter frigidisoli]TCD12103.1 hypothetical protein EZ449_03540 [Pedobacter frigidisoli]